MKSKCAFLILVLFQSAFLFAQLPDVPRGNLGKEQYIALLIEKLKVAEAKRDTLNSLRFASILATTYQTTNIMERSEFYIVLAKQYAGAYSDSSWMAEVSNRIGMFLQAKAQRMSKKLSGIYSIAQMMDSSIWWHKNAMRLGVKHNRLANTGWGYRGVMESVNAKYLKTEAMEDSMDYYYSKGMEISETVGDQELSNSLKIQYFRYFLHENQPEKARKIIELLDSTEFIKLSVQNGVHDLIAQENNLDTLEVLRRNVWEQYKLRLAAEHNEILYETDQKYEVTKTKNILEMTQEELVRSKKVVIGSVGIAVFILLISFYLYRLYRKNKRLSLRNELLLKEQNHRVKNNLQMINSLLSLQSQKLPSSDAKDALNESQFRINSVALLHRMLYEEGQVDLVNIEEYLQTLSEEISYAVPRQIKTNLQIPSDFDLEIERATSLGLIINELMTNSIKHVSEAVELMIFISITKDTSGDIVLRYSDNGEGVDSKAWNTSKSFGNQLIRLQSEQLRGKYRINDEKGFEYELRMGA